MNDDWLHKIHDQMADYEIEEPDDLWEAIDEKRLQIPLRPHKSRRIMVLRWGKRFTAAAAMLAIVLSVCMYIYDGKSYMAEPKLMSSITKPDVLSDSKVVNHVNATVPPAVAAIVQRQSPRITSTAVSASRTIGKTPVTEVVAVSSDTDNSVTHPRNEDTVAENTDSVTPKHPATKYPDNRLTDGNDSRNLASIGHKKGNNDKLSFSVFTSSGTGYAANRLSTGDAFVSSIGPDDADWEDNPILGILLFNQGKDIETDIKHRLPIRFGVSFAYNLNDRFSIESGVSYTNLTSDIKEGSESYYFIGEQKLHYVGVPLNLKYRVLSLHKFDLYASAGVLAEKCVSAEVDKDFILDFKKERSETEKLDEKPMQFSINASAGLQYNITDAIGLYAEPGVSYYFNDGSSIKNIYKEKPMNFNLNIGLRFTFGN